MTWTNRDERESRKRSADNWARYQESVNRKGFHGTVVQVRSEPEYHVSGECEHFGCHKPIYKSIYAFGYLAGMCEEHYWAASQEDRDAAVQFKYAER